MRPSTLRAALSRAAITLAACAFSLGAQDRTLSWPAIDVTAHLDADGRLAVRERQTILLSGDWNGPERTFSIPFGQRVTLKSLTRIDPLTGATRPMRADHLTAVDDYAWTNSSTLRWRSRLPSDPPHDSTTLIYELDLLYEFILVPDGERRFRLAHDFAFSDRWENIEAFKLTLTLDPVWRVPDGFTGQYSAGPLVPGESFTVTLALSRDDAALPASMHSGAPREQRLLAVGSVAIAAILFLLALVLRERRLGRFAPSPQPQEITREWLERHVLAVPPEIVGTAWDDTTAAPEVAATLARMIADGQMQSSVKELKVWKFRRQDLQLKLLVPRSALSEHDRILVDALFDSGRDSTSTLRVRERYKTSGFDPAALINPSIRQRLNETAGLGQSIPAPSRLPTLLLLIVAVGLMARGVTMQPTDLAVLLVAGPAVIGYVVLAVQANLWQRQVTSPLAGLIWRLVVPLALAIFFVAKAVLGDLRLVSSWGFAGLACFLVALINSVCNLARSRHDATRIAARKRLAAARARFAQELKSPKPALLDAWYPWVLAFGLAHVADRWFAAFGAATTSTRSGRGFSGSSSSGGGAGSAGWSGFGGGGGFAGAGSSASFGAAIGGMAASVPSPSSSSSGGGGGSSSGGGGGGGW